MQANASTSISINSFFVKWKFQLNVFISVLFTVKATVFQFSISTKDPIIQNPT